MSTETKNEMHTLPPLPRPACTYADHSYPAYTKRQMEEYARAAIEWAKASAQPAEGADKPNLATLLEAAGARRSVLCHDGSDHPFDAYDKAIADRVVGQLSLRLTKLRTALQEISEIRYGYEPDSSATGIANDALFSDDEEAK